MSDFISKSRLKWEIEKWYEKEYYSSFNTAVYNALLKIIDRFPSVEPEKRTEERTKTHACDCISRQAAIEAEKEMCKYYTPTKSTYHPHIDFVIEELQKLPSVTPEIEKCGDCISRKAATDRFDLVQSDDKCMGYDDIMAFLLSLPSVEPERPHGKWEYVQYDGNQKIGNWHCSNCRLIVNLGFEGAPYYHYCPGCGADMKGEHT